MSTDHVQQLMVQLQYFEVFQNFIKKNSSKKMQLAKTRQITKKYTERPITKDYFK